MDPPDFHLTAPSKVVICCLLLLSLIFGQQAQMPPPQDQRNKLESKDSNEKPSAKDEGAKRAKERRANEEAPRAKNG